MATIEVNGRYPADYNERGRPNTIDDEAPTTVTVTANVTNHGTAAGQVKMILYDVASDLQGRSNPARSDPPSGFHTVHPLAGSGEVGDPRPTRLRIEYGIPDGELMTLRVEILDSNDDLLEGETFSVNSWEQPRVADLRSTSINIRVT